MHDRYDRCTWILEENGYHHKVLSSLEDGKLHVQKVEQGPNPFRAKEAELNFAAFKWRVCILACDYQGMHALLCPSKEIHRDLLPLKQWRAENQSGLTHKILICLKWDKNACKMLFGTTQFLRFEFFYMFDRRIHMNFTVVLVPMENFSYSICGLAHK